MNRTISSILGHPEAAVAKAIAKLEAKNGYPSHDVRHLAENIQKTRIKLAELGLDPDDTTGEELYHSLLARFRQDSQLFDERFSLVGTSDNRSVTLATRMVLQNFEMPERWVLKSSVAKKLLKAQPPKKLMQRLSYRSVDSLLKREQLAEIYLGISYTETAIWHRAYSKLVCGLDSTAFEMRRLSLGSLNAAKWGELETEDLLAYNNDYGVLGFLPAQQNIGTLSLVVLLLDGLASFKELKVSEHASKLSRELIWWSDMDGLVANLNSEHISMSLDDVSLNDIHSHNFQDRVLEAGQRGFWWDLLSRYDNQLIPENDLNISFSRLLNLKAPLNQPAFEYAEDI
jgi:hypothetical protein